MGFPLCEGDRKRAESMKNMRKREKKKDANCSTNAFILLRSWAAINVVYGVWYPKDIEEDASAFVCIFYLALLSCFSPSNLFRSLSLSRFFSPLFITRKTICTEFLQFLRSEYFKAIACAIATHRQNALFAFENGWEYKIRSTENLRQIPTTFFNNIIRVSFLFTARFIWFIKWK